MTRFPPLCELALAGLFSLSTSAHAATLQLVMEDTLFDPGDPVTIRLVGDAEGAIENTMWAALTIDSNVLTDVQVQTFVPTSTDGAPWMQAFTAGSCYRETRCSLMSMIHPYGLTGVAEQGPFTYAVVTAKAGLAGGAHTLDFVTEPRGQRVDFFGLSSAPGVAFTITGDYTPPPYEPPTPPVVTPPPPVVTPPPPQNNPPRPPPGPLGPVGGTAGGGAPIPEPSAALLFAAGIVVVQLRLRRRRA